MKLSDFNYILPKELIAQYPDKNRDASRMLVLNRHTGAIEHKFFYNIPDYLNNFEIAIKRPGNKKKTLIT